MVKNNGKWLEDLVHEFERKILPPGFSITPNVKKFSHSGKQTGEFDLVIEGNVGTLKQRILIECRDRPSDGKQGAGWISEVDGKKKRNNFTMAVAVSSTGFTQDAIDSVTNNHHQVTLKTVEKLQDLHNEFSCMSLSIVEPYIDVKNMELIPSPRQKLPSNFAPALHKKTLYWEKLKVSTHLIQEPQHLNIWLTELLWKEESFNALSVRPYEFSWMQPITLWHDGYPAHLRGLKLTYRLAVSKLDLKTVHVYTYTDTINEKPCATRSLAKVTDRFDKEYEITIRTWAIGDGKINVEVTGDNEFSKVFKFGKIKVANS